MPKTSPPAANGGNLNIEQAAEASQQSFLAMTQLHSRLIRNALEVNAELVDFARKRIHEEIRTNDELCRCSNVNEAVEVMSGFYQKAFEAYATEANNLVKISTEAVSRSLEDGRETQA